MLLLSDLSLYTQGDVNYSQLVLKMSLVLVQQKVLQVTNSQTEWMLPGLLPFSVQMSQAETARC